jgi:DNA-binding HxlR family transcriptional regulator/putative sterol carrier protein
MRRSYQQYCAVAKALDLVGERWTLLILRDLVHLGPRRFSDLLRALPGIGKSLLSARLRRLEQAGLVSRRRLPPPAASVVYELTELGRGLEPAIIELGRWGGNFMGARAPGETFLPSGHISAIRATFRPEAAKDTSRRYQFVVDGEPFFVVIDDGAVTTCEGTLPYPDLLVATDVETSIALMTRALSPVDALVEGRVRIEGEESEFERCIDLIAWLPRPAARPPERGGSRA